MPVILDTFRVAHMDAFQTILIEGQNQNTPEQLAWLCAEVLMCNLGPSFRKSYMNQENIVGGFFYNIAQKIFPYLYVRPETPIALTGANDSFFCNSCSLAHCKTVLKGKPEPITHDELIMRNIFEDEPKLRLKYPDIYAVQTKRCFVERLNYSYVLLPIGLIRSRATITQIAQEAWDYKQKRRELVQNGASSIYLRGFLGNHLIYRNNKPRLLQRSIP